MFRSLICCSRRLMALLLLLLLMVSLVPGRVRAQTDSSEPTAEVATLITKAQQAGKANNFVEKLRLLESALQKAQAQNDTAGTAYALLYLGVQNSAGLQFDTGIRQLQRALPFFQQRHITKMQVAILTILAEDCKALNQQDKALNYVQQAVAVGDDPAFATLKMEALFMAGGIYMGREQWAKAVESFELALPYMEQGGSKDQRSLMVGTLAYACLEAGDYLKSMQYSQRTLQARAGVTDRNGEGLALTALTCVYANMGQYAQSRDFAKQATDVWRALGRRDLMLTMQMVLGVIYQEQGQSQTALTYLNQALPLLRQSANTSGLAACLVTIGGAYRSLNQPAKSLPRYEEAARLYHSLDNWEWEGATLNYQAEVYLALGQKTRARQYFQQALTVLNRALTSPGVAGNALEEAGTLYNIAVAEEENGQLAQARTHLDQAVLKADRVRASVGGFSDLKVSFVERILYGLHRSIALLIKSKQPEQAFDTVQKIKARALLDLMAGGKVDIRQSLTAEQAQREQELRQSADKLNADMVREGVNNEVGAKKRFAALKEQLTRTEHDLQAYEDSLYAQHPELAAKRAATTVTLQEVARFLPDDTALLEFATLYAKEYPDMSGADHTLLFVVTKQNGAAKLSVFPVDVTRAALSAQVEAFRDLCADPRKAYQGNAQKLYDLLLRPAAPALGGIKRLVVCPDGPLWSLPFAALHDGKQFLLERYEIAYAYSATGVQAALQDRQGRKAPNTLLALGNPDFGGAERFGDNKDIPGQRPLDAPSRPVKEPTRPLDAPSRPLDAPSRPLDAPSRVLLLPRGGHITTLPGTQREMDMLRKEIPDAAIYTGADAQESIVKQKAGQYRYLHLASHAFFNDASPLLSSVVLAKPAPDSKEDGYLTARELFDMNLQADMVVLSACNTARGDKRSGEGIIGLTWALFVAGAPTQVLSQWSVDDESTATLMGAFYASLAQGKAAALRAAELSLLHDTKHGHPYYWAPFTLMGDWR